MSAPGNFWWPCVSDKCNGWEWGTRLQCRACKAYAPRWAAQKAAAACPVVGSDGKPEKGPKRGNGKQNRQQSRAKSRARQNSDGPQPGTDSMDLAYDKANDNKGAKQALLQKIKKMEGLQQLMGSQIPAPLADSLQEALEAARQELHAQALAPKRLQALQQGIERKTERLHKIETKIESLAQEREALEPQLMQELEALRLQFRQKHVHIEAEVTELQQQKESLVDSLADLREQLRALVPEAQGHSDRAEAPAPSQVGGEDMQSLFKVSAALVNEYPQYHQVFQEVWQLANRSFEGQTSAPSQLPPPSGAPPAWASGKRPNGAGPWSSPENMDVEDGNPDLPATQPADEPNVPAPPASG
eukprot:3075682-Amphidinium_carterae.1